MFREVEFWTTKKYTIEYTPVVEAVNTPAAFTDSIFSFLFGSRVQLGINGHLANTLTQYQGLGQSKPPTSTMAFSFAIEPLIHTIIKPPAISEIPLGAKTHTAALKFEHESRVLANLCVRLFANVTRLPQLF